MKRILILGGGASGLAAALSAAQADPTAQITVLERLDRVGKKILATGNGRCNLTNEAIAPEHYHSSQPERLEKLLEQMPCQRTLAFFRALGLYCATEELGRVYPNARQASAVLDVLLLALERRGIQVKCNAQVEQLRREKSGFVVETQEERYRADAVILAVGGCAAPKQGTDGAGLQLAQSLGHRSAKAYPCLVALKCSDSVLKGLKGVRAHGTVSLYRGEQIIGQENGEIQFTDYGLSGIPVFQLSCLMPQAANKARLVVDLLPDWTQQALSQMIRQEARAFPDTTLEHFLPGLVHKKLLYAAMKTVGLSPLSLSVGAMNAKQLEQLAERLKCWSFQVTGPLGWEQAQVTGGGIRLDEVNDDFSSRRCDGLYLTGELLDCVGDCGGYNLHWAWCSGMIAGTAAVSQS